MSADTEVKDVPTDAAVSLPAEADAEVAPHPILGGVDIVVGVLLLSAIWVALPARWPPVDVGGSLLALGFIVAGASLLARRTWAATVARALGLGVLVAGASLCTALALAAGDLFGRYGPVGMGGGLILFVVFLLLLPYLVILPAAQLWLLARSRHADETSTPRA